MNDLTNDPHTEAKKWCIFFAKMTEDQARQYPMSFSRCEKEVRPVKLKKGGASAKYWWRFYRYSPDLYAAASDLESVFVVTLVAKYLGVLSVPASQVFSNKLGVFARSEWSVFSLIQSTIHECWARQFSTTLETRLSYTPTDCFETFPFPSKLISLSENGKQYHACRRNIMVSENIGVTHAYNKFHDPDCVSSDIKNLRDLHVEMDQAVAAAYEWTDLDLGHDFHETKQGLRFTISEPARREVLQRLLKLNHERYAEEVKQGLHDKKKGRRKQTPQKKAATKKTAPIGATLFDKGAGE